MLLIKKQENDFYFIQTHNEESKKGKTNEDDSFLFHKIKYIINKNCHYKHVMGIPIADTFRFLFGMGYSKP